MKKILLLFAALALPLAAHAAYYSYSPTEVLSFSIKDLSNGSTYEYTINIEQRGNSGSWYNSTTTIYLTPKTHSFVGEFNIDDGTLSKDSYVYYNGATRKFIIGSNYWSTDNKTTLSITANADGTYAFGGTVICQIGSNIYRYLFTDYIYDPFASEPAQGTVSVTAENITAYDYIKSDGYVELDLNSTEGPYATLGFKNSTFNIPAGTYSLDASGNPGTFIASNGMDGYFAMPSYVAVGWPAEDYFLCSGTITVSYSNGNMTVSGTATSAHGSVITINATGASPFPPEINCLCFTANTSNSTVQLNKVGNPYEATLEYSTTGTTWQTYTFGQTITLANEDDRAYFRNASDDLAKGFSKDFMSNYYQFAMTGSVAASGSVMSLLDNTCRSTTFPYDDGDYTTPEDFNYFVNLFSGCTSLTSAPELPATKLTPYCYMWMFKDCTGLTSAPELPAMELSDWCYGAMFEGCTGLEKAPALPATTMASNCYAAMFRGCTGLTEAPELPAMTLAGGCYSEMFENCTSLETAPTLPATTLELYCYDKMFNGCSKLNLMRVGFTEWTNYTTNNWLNGVASTGTFACPEELDKTQTGASNIPEGWITGPYTFTIMANSSDESKGTVSGGGTYANGDKIILTATPAEDCAFKHWSDGTTANPYVFTATKDVTLTATFVTIFNVQASPADENEGSVSGGGKYEEGTEVTLTATPAENYVFEKWSDGTTANPYVFTAMKDVTLTAMFKEYTRYITDGTEYTATESKFLPEVIYTRTFKNTDWQALYVPFSMDYEEWSEDYDIARVYNFIDYDDNDDGEFDRTYLVVKKMTSGSTKPNYPYLIRAKATGAQTLTLTDKTLEPAQSNSVECSSTDYTYTFTGSYTEVANMYANSYYALSGGSLQGANSPSVVLKPQRWYMSITPKSGDYSATRAQNIKVLVDGEDETEGIKIPSISPVGGELLPPHPSNSPKGESPVAYDLTGRAVSTAANVRGINISNGKKVIR